MDSNLKLPQEGDLYKKILVAGKTFEIKFGFYDENERGRVEPLPVFPDLRKDPVFSKKGEPFASSIDSVCEYYEPHGKEPEGCCGDCRYYSGKEEIGICRCEKRRKIFPKGLDIGGGIEKI